LGLTSVGPGEGGSTEGKEPAGAGIGGWFCLQCCRWVGKVMAKKKSKREYVWLECAECSQRNYRTNVSVAAGAPKLQLKKFCKTERKHTVHKLRRK